MSTKQKLPKGVSVQAEDIFMGLIHQSLDKLSDFSTREELKVTGNGSQGIFVGGEQSAVDAEYLPQIRVSCGDVSDYKGAIDRLKEWGPNSTVHTLITQGYTLISCYSSNDVEVRDLGDYIKSAVLMAREDLGERGIFGIRDIRTTKPKGVDAGGRKPGIYNTNVQFAFMVAARGSQRNVVDPFMRRIGSEVRQEKQKERNAPEVYHIEDYNYEPVIEVVFNKEVRPQYPTGFKLFVDGQEVQQTAVRAPFYNKQIRIEIDEVPRFGSSVVLQYEPGDLQGPSFAVEPFEITLA